MPDSNPSNKIIAALADVPPHIARIGAVADESTKPAVDRYTTSVLDAMLRLRRELRGVDHG
jgi:hypothetical protein